LQFLQKKGYSFAKNSITHLVVSSNFIYISQKKVIMKALAHMLLAVVLGISITASAQPQGRILKIDDSDFNHITGLKFPIEMFGYKRDEIRAFEKGTSNISVKYKKADADESISTFTIFIYPNTSTSTDRLTDEYYKAVSAIGIARGSKQIEFKHKIRTFEKNGFRLRGLVAITSDLKEYLALFESGKWMLKLRITLPSASQDILDQLEASLLDALNPSMLVEKYPWDPSSYKIILDVDLLSDKIFAPCAYIGGFMLATWINVKVGEQEKLAGVPGLYLQGYNAAYTVMIEAWRTAKRKKNKSKFYPLMSGLEQIEGNGYLEEFLMEQFHQVLIVPDSTVLNQDEYENWKKNHSINVNIKERFFTTKYTK
jgi:hypothetical protein